MGPLAPDIYDYGYSADGVAASDPGNRLNLVEVPGDSSAYYGAGQDVPHGDVHMMVYVPRRSVRRAICRVYTPPGYDGGKQRYPVLYLQHGGNCCEYAWMEQARANLILDNLIAAHKARPMIVVMALGARSSPQQKRWKPVLSQMEGYKTPPEETNQLRSRQSVRNRPADRHHSLRRKALPRRPRCRSSRSVRPVTQGRHPGTVDHRHFLTMFFTGWCR